MSLTPASCWRWFRPVGSPSDPPRPPAGRRDMLPCFLTMALVAVFGAGSRGSSPASGVRPPAGDAAFQQDAVSRAERLVQEAKQDGSRYLQSKDESAKKSAKRSLEEAEDLLKKELKRDARCERCVAALTSDIALELLLEIGRA